MSGMALEVGQLYKQTFGDSPAALARAPGRVEVLGNHTDYNEGFVLSCAIDREIFVAVGRSSEAGSFRFISSSYPQPVTVTSVSPQSEHSWVNYPLGVFAMLQKHGGPLPGFNIAIHGNVPLGAGLSSSAALEVSAGLALAKLFGLSLTQRELALAAQRAENTFVGTKCGLLDQFSSLFGSKGRLLFLDFRTLDHSTVSFPSPAPCIAIALSGASHALAESAYNDRREECERAAAHFRALRPGVRTLRDVSMGQVAEAEGTLDPIALRRARHIVGENERVLAGVELLRSGSLDGFGALLYESHRSSRDNFQNSCSELDSLVDLARTVKGVYGSRLTGGGFGGATLTLVDAAALPALEAAVARTYRTPTGTRTTVYAALSAEGASLIPA